MRSGANASGQDPDTTYRDSPAVSTAKLGETTTWPTTDVRTSRADDETHEVECECEAKGVLTWGVSLLFRGMCFLATAKPGGASYFSPWLYLGVAHAAGASRNLPCTGADL